MDDEEILEMVADGTIDPEQIDTLRNVDENTIELIKSGEIDPDQAEAFESLDPELQELVEGGKLDMDEAEELNGQSSPKTKNSYFLAVYQLLSLIFLLAR